MSHAHLTALLPPHKTEGGIRTPEPEGRENLKRRCGELNPDQEIRSLTCCLCTTPPKTKKDVGRTRTCAPERNRLAVDRVNHSATTSYNIRRPGIEPGSTEPQSVIIPLYNLRYYESREGFEPPTADSKSAVLTNYTNRTKDKKKSLDS